MTQWWPSVWQAPVRAVGRPGRARAPRVLACAVALLAGLADRPAWMARAQEGAGGAAPDRPNAPDPQRAALPLEEILGVPAPASRPVRALDAQPEVRRRYDEAVELIGEGEFAQAVKCLAQALDLAAGDYYELPYLMAVAQERLGEHGQARTFAEQAAALRPGAADVHYLLGQLERRRNELEPAIAHFRSATLAAERESGNPNVTAAWFWLGECLARAGYLTAACAAYARFDEAIWHAQPRHRDADEVAAILGDRPHGTLETRLALLRQLGRGAEAVHATANAVERQSGDPYFERLHARTLLEAGQAEAALRFCRERLAADASSPLLGVALAAARAAGQLDSWLAELAQGVADGRRVEFAAGLARRLADAGEPHASARLWRVLAGQRPDDVGTFWALAGALRAAGELEEALSVLSGFVRAHPGEAEVPHALLESWMKRPQPTDQAQQLLMRWSAQTDRDFATDLALGVVAAGAGQPELAGELLGAALDARPELALGHVVWGRLFLSSYRWEEARARAQAALALAPELAAAQGVLAAALDGLDEHQRAEQAYHAAVKLRPDDPGYAVALAAHYRRTGNLLAAQRYFQQALAADSSDADALEDLIDSYLGGGKLELARAQLRRAEGSDLPDDVLRRLRTTLRYARTPYQPEHLAELARQFEELPEDVETGLKLAAGLYLRDRVDEAQRCAEQVLARAPEDERAASLMARVQARGLNYGPAIRILEEFAQRYPNRADIHALLAEHCLADFRLVEARRTLQRLLELKLSDSARQEHRRQLLLSFVEFREFEEALPLLEPWLADDPAWWREKLRILVLAGRYQEALDLAVARLEPAAAAFDQLWEQFRHAAEAVRASPDDRALRAKAEQSQSDLERCRADLLQRRAELVQVGMDARRFRAAEEHVRRWLAAEPDDGQNTQWLVQVLIADGRADEALEVLKRFRPASPLAEVAARGWRARAEAAAGRIDAAVAGMEALLGEQPPVLGPQDRADMWEQLILMLATAGRYDQALACCEQWGTEFDRADRSAQLMLLTLKGSLLLQAARMPEYFQVAEQLLELAPRDAGVNNDLGYSWVDAGQNLERATQMIRRAVADQPLRAAYLDSLGWAYYKAGDFAAAQMYLQRAARLREGQDAVIYDHLADAEYRLGDTETARRHWQKALELSEEPGSEPGPSQVELLARVREKLAALARAAAPKLAPTAEEQAREQK